MCKCKGAYCKHFIELCSPGEDGLIDCMCKKTGRFFEVEEFYTFEENDEDCPNAFELED